ncbi:histidine ammonia-lyase [Pseudomonas citronellolis]|uniref:histidine ammonia-lyase n=1 Tax=Pseudomonas citronellolis TaxID=53408 RepID=UPI00209F3A32|nr:histidine ammonia-lyase [Pseudomonas citronellolis]MCP1645129.1 histidine ammonia-lyase [Pseudomonas citronellolis]MCP1665231.1 histidine ammonia-lyase [Pseudomonas citronellolis]MCP1698665.1 histidine ammonia-lyase [Pseudomonas citronellolis]MCP1703614.1 histidine ammonia-lyase [Pseudomonas citronellolis]MCP1799883.1 histidine ammonia-lyase [Pseudomonas citronellolis]
MSETLQITPGQFSLDQLRAIHQRQPALQLDAACRANIENSARTVSQIIADQRTVYGINTGFGLLARTSIPEDSLVTLQRNLILSHCTGTGPLLDDASVALIMALKIGSLARGFSGVGMAVVDTLLKLYQARVYPCIPSQGSVGASGDLAPLAHMSSVLIGVGQVRHQGRVMEASEGLAIAGCQPLVLGPKEGLALINGTQVSTALALRGLFAAEKLFVSAVVAGSLTVEALKGSYVPFDARIQAVRGQPGQIDVAAFYRELLHDSQINQSHIDCKRVQDPYSLRCQPQVMGACLDHLRFAAGVFLREANAVSDNPLVFSADGDVLSGGNFHAEPVAMAADVLALVIAEIGALSERRIAQLVDPALSGLPAFLVKEGGLNSGFMIAQVTSAALASENKTLAHPASVDSLPTSANQEDHVSMATFAARRLQDMAGNSSAVVAIELLAAAQGVEFHAPLQSSPQLQEVLKMIRAQVPAYEQDRYFAPDIAAARAWVEEGVLSRWLDYSRLYG